MGSVTTTFFAMRGIHIALKLLLLCIFASKKAQSKHFLIETEGDNTEVEGEDYGNTLTEKEIQSVVDGTEFKELYNKLNSTDKENVKKTLYNQYGNDIQKMRAKAKDGTLKEAFNDEECFMFCVCFSGSSTVRSQRGELPIRDLKLGDFILTASHVIFRATKLGNIESVYAGGLQVGDKLIKSENQMSEEVIISIETKWDNGYWSPLTTDGTLLVDGFLASSYASYPHDAAQLLIDVSLIKMFPKQLLDDEVSQHKDGVRGAIKILKKVANKMGLRRKVESDEVKQGLLPTPAMKALMTAGFDKNTEL